MIYCIASRLKEKEYLVVARMLPIGPLCCANEKDIKSYFKHFYKVLAKGNIRSSLYRNHFERLLILHPVIIAIEKAKAESILDEWIEVKTFLKFPLPIISIPHSQIAMRRGFIDKFQVLDIVNDINPKTGIDGNGTTTIVAFNVANPTLDHSIMNRKR
jgi:hypothetical protein